jgi:putative transposase
MTAYIESRRGRFGVEPICRVLGVAVSTFYARRSREPSARARRDAVLVDQIGKARSGYRRVYGVRKTWRQLTRLGISDVGRERVARVMRQQGWQGVRRGRRVHTTRAERAAERARDLVGRRFQAARPNQLWVADFTYLRTYSGFCYLAFILDVYSRMIVGWQIATHMRTELVMDALEMAAALRPLRHPGLVAHSDRGSQYTSVRYTDRLDELGMAPSVGSKGDAYDNAMAEAWVATLKSELVQGRAYPSFEHAEHAALSWIGFYNHERLHEQLGDIPPAEYEARFPAADTTPEQAAQTATDRRDERAAHAAAEGGEGSTPTRHGRFAPAEADRPALPQGAPASLGTRKVETNNQSL